MQLDLGDERSPTRRAVVLDCGPHRACLVDLPALTARDARWARQLRTIEPAIAAGLDDRTAWWLLHDDTRLLAPTFDENAETADEPPPALFDPPAAVQPPIR